MARSGIGTLFFAVMTMFVQGIDPAAISVRRGLGMGTPPPSASPSQPWGQTQGYPYRRP